MRSEKLPLLGMLIAASALAQTARYPTAVATTTDLTNVEDRAQSTLAAGLNATATSFIVVSAAKFTAHMILTIDNEQIKICAITGSTVTVGHGACPSIDGRAFAGTSAASHVAGSLVSDYVVAYQHKALREEIKAIEGTLGVNMSAVAAMITAGISSQLPPPANSPQVLAIDYAFPPQTPGGTLAPGANAITMTPVPAGVNGTDSNHYLYVSHGAGAPEACRITGGTGMAGNASGQIIITCANNHVGAWTIESATGGMQEAINSLTAGKLVVVSAATTVYATTTITSPLTLQCSAGATITWAGGATPIIAIAANNTTVRDCTITAGVASEAITNSGTRSGITVERNIITGSVKSVSFTLGSDIFIADNRISGFTNTGISTQFNVGVTYVKVTGNFVDSSGCPIQYCGAISGWGSHFIATSNQIKIGGNEDGGISWLNSPGQGLTDGIISGNSVQATGGKPFECFSVGSSTNFVMEGNTCEITGALAGGFIGFEVNQSSIGTVHGNVLKGNNPSTTVSGIFLESSSNVSIDANTITGMGTDSNSHAIILLRTDDSAQPAPIHMQGNLVSNNVIKATPGSTAADIAIDTLYGSGIVQNNAIIGNVISGVNTPGHICIRASNSTGGATYENTRIEFNTINGCDTGIQVADGFGATLRAKYFHIGNNRITNTVKFYDDLASFGVPGVRTTIFDSNGIPFSQLGNYENGSQVYCTNCNATCTAGTGSGQICIRLNGAWTH